MKITYIEKFLIVATLMIFGLFLYGRISKPPPAEKVSPENLKSLDLGITAEEFKSVYNQKALERNLPQMQIGDIELGTGSGKNTFGYKFVDTFYLFGEVNPNTGRIKELNITKAIVLSDEESEFQVAALAFLIMIQTLSPALNSSERAAILNKFSSNSKPYSSIVEGNIKYSMSLLENGKIVMFSAAPKKK